MARFTTPEPIPVTSTSYAQRRALLTNRDLVFLNERSLGDRHLYSRFAKLDFATRIQHARTVLVDYNDFKKGILREFRSRYGRQTTYAQLQELGLLQSYTDWFFIYLRNDVFPELADKFNPGLWSSYFDPSDTDTSDSDNDASEADDFEESEG